MERSSWLTHLERLSGEKGLFTLLEAVKGVDVRLKIIGDGPLRKELEEKKGNNTYCMGYMPQQKLKKVVKDSMAMVIPSEWYENNPRSVLEAFALGKPIIGAKIGGIPELVKDKKTGFCFESGSVEDLRGKLTRFLLMPRREIQDMGRRAREFVEEEFNPEKHYQGLMEVYQIAMDRTHLKEGKI